jgi:kinesin family protein 5
MRAKSIKNKARVNVEMSPAELKALLKKTVAELAAVREHNASLEEEVKLWRAGGKVDKDAWTPSLSEVGKSSATAAARKLTSPVPSATGTPGRMDTPAGLSPAFADSRPETPSAYSSVMDKDEREDFLKRENELSDQLAEKVGHLVLALWDRS